MTEEKKKEWKHIKEKGFIMWWVNEGVVKFLLPVFVIIVFFVNPLIMNSGIGYFSSNFFRKNIIINGIILSILSLLKAILTWNIIDTKYKKETNKQKIL